MFWSKQKWFLLPAQPLMCGWCIVLHSIIADQCHSWPVFAHWPCSRHWTSLQPVPSQLRCFPGGLGSKRICLQCRRPGFDPWVRKISWRRKWQPTPVFLPGKSHVDREAWWATIHEVTKTWLSNQTTLIHSHQLQEVGTFTIPMFKMRKLSPERWLSNLPNLLVGSHAGTWTQTFKFHSS